MQTNVGMWDYYSPNFVDPLYKPYQRKCVKGIDNKQYSINPYKKQGSEVYPELVRFNKGAIFQKQFNNWACPMGYESYTPTGEDTGYCIPKKSNVKDVFYSDIYEKQHPNYFTYPEEGCSAYEFDKRGIFGENHSRKIKRDYKIEKLPYMGLY